ncbi:outer membrane protein [Legionella jordanis]|uniref:Opacity protein and related surface antigens n=1 Tax=Legionella jordanis TaxID=456 RepID=A0A0W0V8M8_9GAMM|nr:hypothetical protein [Legionella jordanis]KTD16483.1 hypothetical protein Ljor_0789 [Legionella jordanis]RMX03969.1 porin family protein [Legionella jordanis]RMX21962.1 porin family protein [Legionella jordanis]VEH12057.1 Opacity protein and related surface antigens [Legionella jordanis]HAT8712642.1 porin family protein [Legionella jordanis]
MSKNHFLSLATGVFLPIVVSAGSMGEPFQPTWQWVGAISAGPAWTRTLQNQTLYLAPEIEKAYIANKHTDALASGELFLGLQEAFSPDWHGQIGLAGVVSGNAKLQGIIWDDADPQFANYRYDYKLFHSHIAVKGKLFKELGYWVTPWVSGSLGVGFNRSYDFNNSPLIPEALANSNFSNHTKTAFTYTVGAGVQKHLGAHWSIGAGYEFADWGKSELGKAAGQLFDNRLKLNHLYSNAVLFNLTYLA